MLGDSCEQYFELNAAEVETLRRAAVERNLPYDGSRICYSKAELRQFGLVREAYTTEELRARVF